MSTSECHWDQYSDHPYYKQISATQSRVPLFLFRTIHRFSGGKPFLNGPDAIVPLAFHHGAGHNCIYDLGGDSICDMAQNHYWGHDRRTFQPEFSSWSPSLLLVLAYAAYMQQWTLNVDIRIAVLDTRRLSKKQVIAVVTALAYRPGQPIDWAVYDTHEYLIHGPVRSDEHGHLKVVSFSDILNAGLSEILPEFVDMIDKADWRGENIRNELLENFSRGLRTKSGLQAGGCSQLAFFEKEVQVSAQIGALFGDRLAFGIACGVLSIEPRLWLQSSSSMKSLDDRYAAMMQEGFKKLAQEDDWKHEPSITTEGHIDTAFIEVQQMYQLLRYMSTPDAEIDRTRKTPLLRG